MFNVCFSSLSVSQRDCKVLNIWWFGFISNTFSAFTVCSLLGIAAKVFSMSRDICPSFVRQQGDQKYIYYAAGESVAKIDCLPQTEVVKDKGYEILYLTESVDEFAIQMLRYRILSASRKPSRIFHTSHARL